MYVFWSKQRQQRVFSLWLLLLLFNCFVRQSETFVVPQELPTLLSLIYSNIPPIKKGTDSRVGFGFRLGEHADFQVVLELGPQKNTRPLGEDAEEQSFNKRQVTPAELQVLQRKLLKEQIRQKQEEYLKETSTERTAATWLQSWSQDMNGSPSPKPLPKIKSKSQSAFKIAQTPKPPLPPQPNMEEHAMAQLQQLYKMATTTTTTSTTTSSTTSSTTTPAPFKGGPLNLGGPSGFKLLSPALSQDSNLLTIGESNTKTKSEITKELMDVSLEEEEAKKS